MDKTQNAINLGGRAAAMLDSDLFKQAVAQLEADYIAAWKATPPRDTDARERYWLACQVVGKVRDHLINVMNNGKLAKAEIEQITRSRAA